jgi:hypothetical protein
VNLSVWVLIKNDGENESVVHNVYRTKEAALEHLEELPYRIARVVKIVEFIPKKDPDP